MFSKTLLHKGARLILFSLCTLITCTVTSHGAQPENLLREFPRTQLIINTSNRKCILFDVYVAQTSAQRSQGLMHIESMGTYEGMIFIYSENIHISMWMKNTLIPLDMLFIDANLRIVSMHPDAVPYSEEIIKSGQEVIATIELNAGSIEYFQLESGNKIIFPAG